MGLGFLPMLTVVIVVTIQASSSSSLTPPCHPGSAAQPPAPGTASSTLPGRDACRAGTLPVTTAWSGPDESRHGHITAVHGCSDMILPAPAIPAGRRERRTPSGRMTVGRMTVGPMTVGRQYAEAVGGPPSPPDRDDVRSALLGVIDPELGDNVVDLGMVDDIRVRPDGRVTVGLAL